MRRAHCAQKKTSPSSHGLVIQKTIDVPTDLTISPKPITFDSTTPITIGENDVRIALTLCVTSLLLAACETPTTQRYAISADNNQAIKAIGSTGIGVEPFAPPKDFSPNCRALGPMEVADNLTHTQYIQKAFEEELKIAGAYAATSPRITIGGNVNKLEFSSSKGLTNGYWLIDISLHSSNGKTLQVNENYEFHSGFAAVEACRNTAEAYSRAVQDLVGKALKSPDFAGLLL